MATVGKMSRGRGHEEAIAAAARLPGVCLVHVGHGEHMPALKERAAALGAADRNFWLGYQEEALPDLYRLCDVFLFTASGADQGQRAILEAMASGLPVVALERARRRDLMTDGVEGAIARDAPGLAPALESGRRLRAAAAPLWARGSGAGARIHRPEVRGPRDPLLRRHSGRGAPDPRD